MTASCHRLRRSAVDVQAPQLRQQGQGTQVPDRCCVRGRGPPGSPRAPGLVRSATPAPRASSSTSAASSCTPTCSAFALAQRRQDPAPQRHVRDRHRGAGLFPARHHRRPARQLLQQTSRAWSRACAAPALRTRTPSARTRPPPIASRRPTTDPPRSRSQWPSRRCRARSAAPRRPARSRAPCPLPSPSPATSRRPTTDRTVFKYSNPSSRSENSLPACREPSARAYAYRCPSL